MIHIVVGVLHEQGAECLLRPIRADMVPVSAASRDLDLAAGERMRDRLEHMGLIPVGGAVVTPGGDLSAAFVIHVVVSAPDEPETSANVQKALRNGLRRAADLGLASLALPPLGMGVGSLEAEESARVMLEILFHQLDERLPPSDITVVVASDYEASVFSQLVAELALVRTEVGH